MKIKGGKYLLLCFLLIVFVSSPVLAKTPLTLEEAIKQALKKNSQFLNAKSALDVAKLNFELAKKSSYSPQVNLNLILFQGSYYPDSDVLNSRADVEAGMTVKLPIGPRLSVNYQGGYDYEKEQYNDSYSAQVSYPLFKDPKLTSEAINIHNSDISLEKAKLNLNQNIKEVEINTINNFLSLLESEDSLKCLEERIKLNKEELEKIRKKKQENLSGELNFLTIKVSLAENERALQNLQDKFSLDKMSFLYFLGLSDKDISLTIPLVKEGNLEERVQKILNEKVSQGIIMAGDEVRKAMWEVEKMQLQLRKSYQDLQPDLSLGIRYNSEGDSPGGGLSKNEEWKLSLTIDWTLFDGGAEKLKEKIAQNSLKDAQRELGEVIKSREENILSMKNNLRNALNELEIYKLKQKKIEIEEKLMNEQFNLGSKTQEELKNFKITKMEFERDYRGAIHNLLISYLQYRKILGLELNIDEVIAK